MPRVHLRPETESDLPFLLSVYASTRADELAMAPWPDSQKEEFVRSQFGFQRKHYREAFWDAQFDVIEVEGVPAGRLYVHRGAKELHIIDISLLPQFRSQGVGRSLLEQLLAEAREHHQPTTIHVERFNPARRLYERVGFKIVGEEGPVYLKMECGTEL